MAQETQAPKIEFPCPDYSIKVVGRNSEDFKGLVVEVIQVHAPDLDLSRISINDSSNGNFRSVRLFITATGPEQLSAIHKDLLATGRVTMVI